MSFLQDILFFSHLGRSPIIIKPLWKLFSSSIWAACPLQWNHFEKSLHFSPPPKFSPGQVVQYNKTTLNFFCIFHHFEKIFVCFKTFHLGRSPITTRPLWKISAFFTTLKNLRNLQNLSSGQVAHYNKTTLKNLCIFHHFEKSFHFLPGQVAHYNKTTLKNLCIFHLFEKSLYFSSFWKNLGRSPITTRPLWKISVFFTILKKSQKIFAGRTPITIRPSQKKIFFYFL